MKTRNRINQRTAKQYLQSYEKFTTSKKESKKIGSMSSFFVELHLDFLPEPLILTTLLECSSDKSYHLAIEKE